MKISKFNEALAKRTAPVDNKELENFIELIIDKFFGDDLGNMGSYECMFEQKNIRSHFYFMVIDEDEIKILQKITEYFKTFDPTVRMYIRRYDDEPNMVDGVIDIKLSTAYSEIYKELEMEKDAKKYNV